MANFDININYRIRLFRKNHKLTQKQFAESLGITQSTLSDIERGKIGVSTNITSRLINKYNIDATWLMTGCQGVNIDKDDIGKPHYMLDTSVVSGRSFSNFDYSDQKFQLDKLIALNANLISVYSIDIMFKVGILAFGDEQMDEILEAIRPDEEFIKQFFPYDSKVSYVDLDIDGKIKVLSDLYNVNFKILSKILSMVQIIESKGISE
ncbi:MAG: helix-turn-helix transcriptional regulator [Bacteroides sp.]|nr:helix-turn-helix transcriptional regulator [Bacteroides sp.]MBD5347062.1 helix-turn-helix transcriptional regulator [Bacteroides sp.]